MKYLAIFFAVICAVALIAAIWFPNFLGQLLLTAGCSFIVALVFATVASMQADAVKLTERINK